MPYVPTGSERLHVDVDGQGVSNINLKEINGYGGLVSSAGSISEFFPGVPASNATVLMYVAQGPMVIPAGARTSYGAQSYAKAVTAATASTTFTILQNATTVGTIVFAAAGTVATINIAANITLAQGDILRITAPASADATLANIAISLAIQF